MDVDRKRNILFGWIVAGFHGINTHVSGSFNQCRRVDRPTPSEALLRSHIRINLVGLEVTEPRMVPSNGWKSCLRPLSWPKTRSVRKWAWLDVRSAPILDSDRPSRDQFAAIVIQPISGR